MTLQIWPQSCPRRVEIFLFFAFSFWICIYFLILQTENHTQKGRPIFIINVERKFKKRLWNTILTLQFKKKKKGYSAPSLQWDILHFYKLQFNTCIKIFHQKYKKKNFYQYQVKRRSIFLHKDKKELRITFSTVKVEGTFVFSQRIEII